MRVVYIAEDGLEFDNLEDCDRYESEYNKIYNDFISYYKFYDDMFHLIPIDSIDDIEDAARWCQYVTVSKQSEYLEELLQFVYDHCGLHLPTETGYFEWNDNKGCWNNINKIRLDYEHKLYTLKSMERY